MSFRAAFLAKTSVWEEKSEDSPESGVVYGEKWQESLMKYDLDTHSWKTRLSSQTTDWRGSSLTLPKSGTMRNGVVLAVPKSERFIKGKDFGYLVSTPTASMPLCKESPFIWRLPSGILRKRRNSGKDGSLNWSQEMAAYGQTPTPELCEKQMLFPADWTDLRLSATHKFHAWLQQHGISYKNVSLIGTSTCASEEPKG